MTARRVNVRLRAHDHPILFCVQGAVHLQLAFACLLTISFFVLNTARAQDWPQWRGPQRDGSVPSFTSPQTWPASLQLKWKAEVGAGYASPVTAAGRVYVHARKEEQETVSCFNLENGNAIWQKSYAAVYQMNPAAIAHGKGPKSTPLIAQGKLYTFGISGIGSCFDAATGELQWRREFSKEFSETAPRYGVSMSPLMNGDLLIVHAGGSNQGALMALAAHNGETKWRWDGDGPSHASPILVEFEGDRQIVTQSQNFALGVSATTGQLLWSIPFTTDYDQNIVTPAVHKQTIIFSGLEKGTVAVKISKSGKQWMAEEVWRNPEISMYMTSPVVQSDLIFGMSDKRRGQFFCLEAATGKTLWVGEGRQGENAAILNAGEVLFLFGSRTYSNGPRPVSAPRRAALLQWTGRSR
ncbi:MAG: PQQ-binding-like beta-propeller repeat protein [bacterium]